MFSNLDFLCILCIPKSTRTVYHKILYLHVKLVSFKRHAATNVNQCHCLAEGMYYKCLPADTREPISSRKHSLQMSFNARTSFLPKTFTAIVFQQTHKNQLFPEDTHHNVFQNSPRNQCLPKDTIMLRVSSRRHVGPNVFRKTLTTNAFRNNCRI